MSLKRRVAERVEVLGRLGKYLSSYLPKDMREDYVELELGAQLGMVQTMFARGRRKEAVAIMVLCCDVMVQLPAGDVETLWLVRGCFEPMVAGGNDPIDLSRERVDKPFPLKAATQAGVKVNVSFSDAYESLCKYEPAMARMLEAYSGYMRGFTNDQAAMCVLAAAALKQHYPDCVQLAISMVREPESCKDLTVVIKGLGLNSTKKGAAIVEGQCLQGKGLSRGSIFDEVKKRCASAPKKLYDEGELRRAIRTVLRHELDPTRVSFRDPDDFWSSRWLWCVNGGHSRAREKDDPLWSVECKGRVHRRVAMENWVENPLYEWDGSVYVSASWKEENGKVRLILACDTVSYVCFEHFLKPVEQAWRNDRVLLDPGSGGMLGVAQRVRDLGSWNSISVMMDYDDFNSQHTTESMQILFEEACAYTNYDRRMATRLVDSFGQMEAYAAGVRVGRIAGTLMSGHRGTTFINSILNAAYIIAAEPSLWANQRYASLHTGDDVVSVFYSYSDVEKLLTELRRRGVRLNPLKQSIGIYTREFLRLAMSKNGGIGYVMRSISSTVSGNWVTDGVPGPEGVLMSMVGNARSLLNRSGSRLVVELLIKSVCMRTGYSKKYIRPCLMGEMSFNSGPVYDIKGSTQIKCARVTYTGGTVYDERDLSFGRYRSYATEDYLSNHVSVIERWVLESRCKSVFTPMLEASYAKSLTDVEPDLKINPSQLAVQKSVNVRGFEWESDVRRRLPYVGVLSKYPVLQLLRHRLKTRDLREIIRKLGRRVWDDVELQAWGSESRPITVQGLMPYSDACLCSQKTRCGVIRVTYEVCM